MISALLILVLAAFFAWYVLPPPKPYRWIAFTNFIMFAALAILFSVATGEATRGVDALKFYVRGPVAFGRGFESLFQADFMYFLSGALQKFLPLSYTGFNLLAALMFSYVGLVMIMRINPTPTRNTLLIWWIFTLLPGVHFWHANFGKEALQLLLIGCIFGAKGLRLYLGGFFVLFLVRPHIAIVLAMAEIIKILLSRKKRLKDTVVMAAATLVGFYALSYIVTRLGGGELSIAELLRLFDGYGDEWNTTNLRLNDTSSIWAFPDFFLRPYPGEIVSTGYLVAAFDAWLLCLFVTYLMIKTLPRGCFQTPWLFAALLTLMMVFTNPNVGTAARKKQLLPVAAIIVLASVSRRRMPPAEMRRVSRPLKGSANPPLVEGG